MRIQLASDLHLEFLEHRFPGERLIAPAHGVDVLVLAGDIHNGSKAVDLFKDWPVPVLLLAGNHESYSRCWQDVQDEIREKAEGTSVKFLERDVADFGGVRFLGCTLWIDYRLRCNRTQRQLMEVASLQINDHQLIRNRDGSKFSPTDALRDHELSRAWLEAELNKEYDGKTVVVTHHGPHPLSVHPRYAGQALNAAFVSNLTDTARKSDFWLHGHVHDNFDYKLGGRCRVVVNPRGYARNRNSVDNVKELEFENSNFQYACVIDTADQSDGNS